MKWEICNKLTAVRGEGGGGDCLKEGEGISQRTYMHVPWTWTTVRRLTVGMRGGWSERVQREKNWDNVIL